MGILIGGSPSTGSSLLRRMLNRHSQVFCGSETALFAKIQLYQNWNGYKGKIFKKSLFGLSNAGWHNFVGVALDDEYDWSRKELIALIKKSESFPKFVAAFYEPMLKAKSKALWAEKTPSNAFTLQPFLETFGQEDKVIHIIRHPLDTIASLMARGLTGYNATAVYLLNVDAALRTQKSSRSLLVRYEDLVQLPEPTCHQLCEFMEVDYDGNMLEPKSDEGGLTQMSGWQADETKRPTAVSVGRFQSLPIVKRKEISAYVSSIKTTDGVSIKELTEPLGYKLNMNSEIDTDFLAQLNSERQTDIRKRRFSNYYFKSHNYPIKIIEG